MCIFRGNPQRTGVLDTQSPTPPLGERWRFSANDAVQCTPVVANGMVFFGSHDKHFYAIDLATGELRWKFATKGRIFSAPYIHEDAVYFGSEDCKLYCLDAATGEERWQFLTGDWVDDSPLVVNGVLLAPSTDKRIYGIDIKTGKPKWSTDTGCKSVNTPAVDGNEIFLTSGYLLIALKLANGRPSWRYRAKRAQTISTNPVVGPDAIYFGTVYGQIWAIDRVKHTIRWTFQSGNRIVGAPVLDGDRLFFGSRDFNIYSLDAHTGKLVWKIDTGDEVEASPVVAGDILCFDTGGFNDPLLQAVDKRTGKPIWSHGDESDILTTIIHDGHIIYTTDDGDVVALG